MLLQAKYNPSLQLRLDKQACKERLLGSVKWLQHAFIDVPLQQVATTAWNGNHTLKVATLICMLNSSCLECLCTVASRWWRPSLWLVILLNIQISQPSFAAASRRGAQFEATWKYNQCPPAASFIFHNFLQWFEWHPCNILCAVCGVCKQGDYPKKTYIVLNWLWWPLRRILQK